MKRLIAEFEEQSYTQIIFPHSKTDWAEYLDEAEQTFIKIINSITKYQKCLVICYDINAVKKHFQESDKLFFTEYETDDTWARDCSALCVEENSKVELLDFRFDGWGGKFEASKDNAMTKHINKDITTYDFILEGGAVESNGVDAILTTSQCMLNKNRNANLDSIQITQKLNSFFGATKILYLNHGYLVGDDTDSHIDTLARFVNEKTLRTTAKYMEIAKRLEISPVTLAVAYSKQFSFVASTIIGARTAAQLDESFAAMDIVLSDETIAETKTIQEQIMYPMG